MTRFMLTTVAAAAFAATTALADDQLRTAVDNEFQASNMMVDVSQLTDEQVNEIYLIATSTDDHGEKRNKLVGVLEEADFASMEMGGNEVWIPVNSLEAQVETGLADFGYNDVEVSELSEEQLAELYIAISGEDREEAMTAIEGVLQ